MDDDTRWATIHLPDWTTDERAALEGILDEDETAFRWDGDTLRVPEVHAPRVRILVEHLRADAWPGGVVVATSRTRPFEGFVWDEREGLDRSPRRRTWIASPGRRMAATIADSILVALILAIVGRALGAFAVVSVLVNVGYGVIPIARTGRTVGAALLHIRVVATSDLGAPGLRRAAIRWIVPSGAWVLSAIDPRLIFAHAVWSVLVFVGVFRVPLRQGLHDRASGVVVVDDRVEPTDEWLDLLRTRT